MKVSPSSLKTFLTCERAWYLKYVQRAPESAYTGSYLEKGRDYDWAVQAYIQGRPCTTPLAARQLEATRRHLPGPDSGALTQVRFSHPLGDAGDTLMGTADIVVADTRACLVIDTKTTAGPQYALTADTLPRDPQCLVYAYLACRTYDLASATMRWVYADKRPNPRGWAVEVEVGFDTASAYVTDVVQPAAARMRELEEALDQTEAGISPAACQRCWMAAHCRWWEGRETRPAGRRLEVVSA